MTEQAAGAVASAVIGGVTDRALTTVIRKLRSRSRPAAAHEKLQRLETLVLKLRCAVEVSEKHAIGSASLLEWRDRLREAAAEGGAVVLDFQRRARAREDGEAASASASATSASASAGAGAGAGVPGELQPAGALYFTRSALGGMAQRVCDATRRLFSTDEDTKKLDSALEKAGAALSGHHAVPDGAAARGLSTTTTQEEEASSSQGRRWPRRRPRRRWHRRLMLRHGRIREWKRGCSPGVLERTLQRLEIHYVKRADDRDMGGLEWLAEWASVIREAMERGPAFRLGRRPQGRRCP